MISGIEACVGCERKIRLSKDTGEFVCVAVEGNGGSINNLGERDVVVG